MALCHTSQECNDGGFTVLDNVFIKQYMPDAPKGCTEAYLLGLALCSENDGTNTADVMCRTLNLSLDDLINAFMYWEELGLVNVFTRPELKIEFLPMRKEKGAYKKIRANKYSDFTKQIQNILRGRQITPAEYSEYFEYLETTLFDPMALVCVARYCVELQGDSVGYSYILTVARNLSKRGVKSLEAVEENLSEHPKYNEDLIQIQKAMRIKRKAEYYDREMYDRWIKEFGFALDCILFVAKQIKTGGMNKLNSLLEEYYKKGLFSQKEIEAYSTNKQQLFDIAKTVNKTIGVYYQSLDPVVDTYISAWISKGFDELTLKTIAHYCFVSGTRTLQGMSEIIDKLYKLGITTKEAFDQYAMQVVQSDQKIKSILQNLGLVRNVTANDRANYKTWTDKWNMSPQLIDYAVSISADAANPMSYLNKILSIFFSNNITTVEQAKKQNKNITQQKKPQDNAQKDYPQREYTAEEMRSLFDNLNSGEL